VFLQTAHEYRKWACPGNSETEEEQTTEGYPLKTEKRYKTKENMKRRVTITFVINMLIVIRLSSCLLIQIQYGVVPSLRTAYPENEIAVKIYSVNALA